MWGLGSAPFGRPSEAERSHVMQGAGACPYQAGTALWLAAGVCPLLLLFLLAAGISCCSIRSACLHHFSQLPVSDAEVQCCLIGPACLCCLLPAAGVAAETDCCPVRLQKERCPLSPLARAATARWRGCCVELQRKLLLHRVSKNAEKCGRKLTTQDPKTGKASCLSGCKP